MVKNGKQQSKPVNMVKIGQQKVKNGQLWKKERKKRSNTVKKRSNMDKNGQKWSK